MDLKEQNWKNFCDNHLRDWHGIWTRYSPQGEVIESFQSLRSFRSNLEQTEITHTNRYTYADGRTEEKTWKLNKPAIRSVFFEQGAAAFASQELKPGSLFAVELFFRHEELRHSVIAAYDGGDSLKRTLTIREDATGFPSEYWSAELNLLPERNLTGNWQGTSVTMTPDLNVSPPVPAQLEWPVEGNQTVFFPDGISLSCPSEVSLGTPFTLAANWLVTPSYLQQLTIRYDDSGAFSMLTFEEFHLLDP
ncbi:MAG: DUF3598 family protein [Oscillatoria princeps RMCB-10]|jgi:hypothetical protein|nr:DUF3598 family protein [Oscillatoria princeps RMCB-10]